MEVVGLYTHSLTEQNITNSSHNTHKKRYLYEERRSKLLHRTLKTRAASPSIQERKPNALYTQASTPISCVGTASTWPWEEEPFILLPKHLVHLSCWDPESQLLRLILHRIHKVLVP